MLRIPQILLAHGKQYLVDRIEIAKGVLLERQGEIGALRDGPAFCLIVRLAELDGDAGPQYAQQCEHHCKICGFGAVQLVAELREQRCGRRFGQSILRGVWARPPLGRAARLYEADGTACRHDTSGMERNKQAY